MKIKSEHYQYMKNAIIEKHKFMLENHKTDYIKYRNAGHSKERILWDLLHASGLTPWVCSTLYLDIKDSHIETALKSIWQDIRMD